MSRAFDPPVHHSAGPPGSEAADAPLRPLVVRLGAVGDTVLLTSMLTVLHRRWEAPVDVVVRRQAAAAVLEGLPEVGEIAILGSRRTPYLLAPGQWQFVRWLRRRGPGPAWVLDWVSSIPRLLERGGIDRALMVRQLDHVWRMDALEHHHAWLLRMAALDPPGVEPRPPLDGPLPRPHLEATPAEVADCEGWLAERGWAGSPVVVMQIESRRKKRGRWPVDRWAAVVRGVVGRIPSARVLFAGTAKEAPAVRAVVEATAHPRVHGVAGELPIRRLIALLTRAHSCLSLDTGPAHIAAAVGCPVVVLAGTVHPDLYRPVGTSGRVEVVTGMPPAERPSDFEVFYDGHTVEMVAVDAVLEAWERVSTPGGDGVVDAGR